MAYSQTGKQALTFVLRTIDEQWWLRHGLFWLVRTALVVWLFVFQLHTTLSGWLALRDALILLPLHLLATYSLIYGVLPLLWQERRRALLPGLLAAWFGLGLAANFAYRYYVYIPSHLVTSPFPDYDMVYSTGSHMPLLVTAGVAAFLQLYRQWRRKQLANAQLTQENYQAELQLLKAQVHPHFLFNTLNNLYALTLRQSEQAPEVVARLTGLLHFVMKQGNAPLVTLADEMTLLRNYLALEQLRYGPRLTLEFRAGAMPAAGRIAPLLLLPLVENAFKHGAAEQLDQAYIRIRLAVAGNTFRCTIINTKSSDPPANEQARGIGLQNVRQRLRLLYPGRHRLRVEARPDTFQVRLTLQLPDMPADAPNRSQQVQPATVPAAAAAYNFSPVRS